MESGTRVPGSTFASVFWSGVGVEANAERDELSAELSSAKSDLIETEKSLKVLQEPMVASDLSCAKDHGLRAAAFVEEMKAIREELPS